jgi:lipopolysaccharide heptosyltransferase I
MTSGAPGRVLVVRLGSLGDLIHALPAVVAMREAWPAAEIEWVVERAHAELLGFVPIVSRVIVLGERTVGGWWSTIGELRGRRYDLALDLQGLVKSAALARLSGARRVVGFDRAALREPAARWFYKETVTVGEGRHVIEKNLAVARALGAGAELTPGCRDSWTATGGAHFPLAVVDSPALVRLRAQGVDEFAVLNPGAAWPNKRWPPESFAAVARKVHATNGWTPVVLWGPGEQAIAQEICDRSGGIAVCAPQTSLGDLVAIARGAKLFVSGDTGPVHIAGAVGTPIVALFGPTTPGRNGPWDDRDVSISRYDSCDCHYKRACRRPDTWCLGTVSVDEVVQAITRRLGAR